MTLDELYDRYGETMYHYLALRLGSIQDAEDVLQETFCRLARVYLRWPLVRNPKAFVFTILRNETNRHLRKRIREREGEERRRADDPELAVVVEAPDLRTGAAVSRALRTLPDQQREAVILKIFQGFTFQETARICGVSINTAASRYRLGIAKLRAILEAYHEN
ncbi:MAG: RNA polymerase sigma factor [Candidatus Aminicenantes bacterium]|nr:RNA polymerase sigma factor [Candidatus Aminicenantes bacterium]